MLRPGKSKMYADLTVAAVKVSMWVHQEEGWKLNVVAASLSTRMSQSAPSCPQYARQALLHHLGCGHQQSQHVKSTGDGPVLRGQTCRVQLDRFSKVLLQPAAVPWLSGLMLRMQPALDSTFILLFWHPAWPG